MIGTRRGREARERPCLAPEWRLTQLTNHPERESQHTYYDICPWSADGRHLLFSSSPIAATWAPFGHDTLASRAGRVNLLDTATHEIREVADGAIYLRHCGTFALWQGRRIAFRQDEAHSVSLDPVTGDRCKLPGRVRQVSPDGQVFAVLLRSPHEGGQGAAVGVMNADGSGTRELVSREQLHALTPNRAEFAAEDMLLGNTKWHPDSQHLLVTTWIYPVPTARRSLYIVSRDGRERRWLGHFAHHHSWANGGRQVLFNDRVEVAPGRFEPRMCLIDFDGRNRRVAFDQPVGSHPLMHPAGDCIVDADRRGIWLAHLADGRLERLVDFAAEFAGTHAGTHPHPVWNQDGTKVLYNSAESGHCEVYLLEQR